VPEHGLHANAKRVFLAGQFQFALLESVLLKREVARAREERLFEALDLE
jgi:hypothetical protein